MTETVMTSPEEVRTMREKSSIPSDAMKNFKAYTYKETAEALDKACLKAVEKAQKWDSKTQRKRKVGEQA